MQPDKQLDDDQLKVLEKIQKLLMLADKNPNSAEAASAAAKAQELLLAYNLDASMVGAAGDGGRREEQKVRGGFYEYQAQIWQAVAELNFCIYWTAGSYVEKETRYRHWSGEMKTRKDLKWQKFHRLVGRKHNVAATKAMATYLEQAVERLVMERLGEDNSQRFSNWAVSFRKGAVYDIVGRIYERRREMLAEEQKKAREAEERAAEAATKGASTETAVTIASLAQSERDANADFLYGEGWSAKKRAARAARAAAAAAAEAEYTAWAAANPEEARKQEAERKKETEKAERRRGGGSGPRDNTDYSAWSSGKKAADKIGLDLQAGGTKVAGALG